MTRASLLTKSVALLILLTVPGRTPTAAQQPRTKTETKGAFLDVKIPEFELRNETLSDALWRLARGPAPFAFGFENVLKTKLKDPEVPERRLRLRLKDKTIREILDSLCQADTRFTWSIDGTTVNVFPMTTVGRPSYLLNRRIEKFELKNATDVQQGLLAIVRQLPPPMEQVANAQVGGGDPYPPEPWTVTFNDMTVRQVVNRLALHGGPCAVWIFGGAEDFRSFGFFNTYRCTYEPPERSNRSRKESAPVPKSNP